MKSYDIEKPLIHIHIPKAGGKSVRANFGKWFGPNIREHYYKDAAAQMPPRLNLQELHSVENPVCVFGHFHRPRGYGIEKYYPEVDQFVTILRDPYEMQLSNFYFIQKHGERLGMTGNPDIQTYLRRIKSYMLDHFPRKVTRENYKEIIERYFIEIGITEKLDESLSRIAAKLGFSDPGPAKHINRTERPADEIPEALKAQYIERHELEYTVYNYVAAKFE